MKKASYKYLTLQAPKGLPTLNQLLDYQIDLGVELGLDQKFMEQAP